MLWMIAGFIASCIGGACLFDAIKPRSRWAGETLGVVLMIAAHVFLVYEICGIYPLGISMYAAGFGFGLLARNAHRLLRV